MNDIKDLKYRDRKLLKIPKDTHSKIADLSRELSAIERNRVSMSEITKRVFDSKEITDRLKLGASLRRKK